MRALARACLLTALIVGGLAAAAILTFCVGLALAVMGG